LVQQEALAASDVEDLLPGLHPVVPRHRLGHRAPASVVPVAAVAVLAVTVPIVLAPLLGDRRALGLVGLHHALDVVALGAGVQPLGEIDALHPPSFPAQSSRAHPARRTTTRFSSDVYQSTLLATASE